MSDQKFTDACVQMIRALGACERGEPGAAARYQALYEGLSDIRSGAPSLRLVHDDRSRPRVPRAQTDAEMRMRWYAKNIRKLVDEYGAVEKADFYDDRPKLTLIRGDLQE